MVGDLENGAGKTCKVCGRDDVEFYKGQGRTCKNCVAERSTQWRKNNPVRYRATRRDWENTHVGLAVKRRKNRLKRRYGIKPAQVEERLKEQDYKCAVCKVPLHSPFDEDPPENTANPVVDHDHRDGHVRGILCSACNVALGLLEDDLDIIKGAYRYIKNDQANSALR